MLFAAHDYLERECGFPGKKNVWKIQLDAMKLVYNKYIDKNDEEIYRELQVWPAHRTSRFHSCEPDGVEANTIQECTLQLAGQN